MVVDGSEYLRTFIHISNITNNGSDNDAVALVSHASKITTNGTSWKSDVSIPFTTSDS